MNIDLLKYLSKEARKSATVGFSSIDNDSYKQAFILKDGTTVVISKAIDKTLDEYKLSNPHEIQITKPTKVEISYKFTESANPENDEYNYVDIVADSLNDLGEKWLKYKQDNLYDEINGVIEKVKFLDEQCKILDVLKENMNNILNILLNTNINIDDISNMNELEENDDNSDYTTDLFDRILLIGDLLFNISDTLLKITDNDKIYMPNAKIDCTGTSVEVSDYITDSIDEET